MKGAGEKEGKVWKGQEREKEGREGMKRLER